MKEYLKIFCVWVASCLLALAPTPLFAQNPIVGGNAKVGGRAVLGGGTGATSVSVDAHTYYPGSGLGSCTGTNTCQITTSFVIPTTGDGVYVAFWSCWTGTCSAANTGTITLSDGGTNTYSQVAAASYTGTPGSTQGVVVFSACNAAAGTYTLTVSTTDGVNGFNFPYAEAITLKNAHATGCVDTSVSNAAFAASGTAANVTSAGNVSASGEVAIAATHCNSTTVSNTGTYSTLDSNSSDGTLVANFVGPTSGSTTTAAMTCGASAASVASLVSFRQ